MIYCGIDLSTSSTGIGILRDDKLVHYECIKPKSKNWEDRIGFIFFRLNEIFKNYDIELVLIEDIPLMNGKPTLVKLAAVRGALICACYTNKIPHKALKVSEWRQNAGLFDGTKSGMKREEMKKKAIEKVKELFDINVNDDMAEAILMAYSYKYPVKKLGLKKGK